MKIGTADVIPGHSYIFTDTTAQVIMAHIVATPGQGIGIIATTPGVVHDAQVPHTKVTAINPTATHHINCTADHPHTEVPHHTIPEIKVDPTHIHPTNPP